MTLAEVMQIDQQYYMNTFGNRIPVCFERGEGIYLYDKSGKEYMDFFAGIAVNALGHSHPAIVNAITEKAKKIIHCSNLYYIEEQALLAKLICENSCADKVFVCNSGGEANEGALKLARAYFKKKGRPEKYEFICLDHSFHGRTITTATATGQIKYKVQFEPLTPGFKHIPINDIEALRNAINEHTCAILLEPVQGESGVYPLDDAFAREARRLCDKNDLLLIFDEVQTGIGRTGKLFGYENLNVEPDIFTLAKALGGGFPIGAFCAKEEAAKGFVPGDHGTTFGGNPLACAVALASLKTIIETKIPENAYNMGNYMEQSIMSISKPIKDKIKEIRHRGLLFAVELKTVDAIEVKTRMFKEGYLIGSVGAHTLRILPPLIINLKDIDSFVKTLERVLAETE